MNKPSILIFSSYHEQEAMDKICAGIEEEGVLYEINEINNKSLPALCFEAANGSALDCGIGIEGNMAAISVKGLKMGAHIFETTEYFREIGINAARAVKRKRFIFPNGGDDA